MLRKVTLTESQLNRVILESAKRLVEAYEEYKGGLSPETLSKAYEKAKSKSENTNDGKEQSKRQRQMNNFGNAVGDKMANMSDKERDNFNNTHEYKDGKGYCKKGTNESRRRLGRRLY